MKRRSRRIGESKKYKFHCQLRRCVDFKPMETHIEEKARDLVNLMNRLIIDNDAETAFEVDGRIAAVYNTLPTDSKWRQELRAVHEKAMYKWH